MGSRAAALVREATDIVALIEEVAEVTPSGAAAMALCPFHADKDTPSLSDPHPPYTTRVDSTSATNQTSYG